MKHIDSLELRLSHERGRLRTAKSQNERDLRAVWVAQIEKEILHERAFLGGDRPDLDMDDDELLAALGAAP